ncbi:hypothetical protein Pan258_12260 [Symmachiella dynata]|nr:hypothetical protein Pan258_12260 [Symmachiella dynata]
MRANRIRCCSMRPASIDGTQETFLAVQGTSLMDNVAAKSLSVLKVTTLWTIHSAKFTDFFGDTGHSRFYAPPGGMRQPG